MDPLILTGLKCSCCTRTDGLPLGKFYAVIRAPDLHAEGWHQAAKIVLKNGLFERWDVHRPELATWITLTVCAKHWAWYHKYIGIKLGNGQAQLYDVNTGLPWKEEDNAKETKETD